MHVGGERVGQELVNANVDHGKVEMFHSEDLTLVVDVVRDVDETNSPTSGG